MSQNTEELRIVKINKDLGQGRYVSKDVFNDEIIGVKLSGKQRINFQLSKGDVIYIAIRNLDKNNAWYIYTWRDPMRLDNTETLLEKQRKEMDARFIEYYGFEEYQKLPK